MIPAANFRVFHYTFGMWRLLLIVALIFAFSSRGSAQWRMQDSHSNSDLRGIHSIGHGIAWASGTSGTVLRTTDDGDHWEHCAMPLGADALDFRGIQAFDANTAIVMSVGKGDRSRLYKTTDACRSWRVVFTNPSNDGFFDAISFSKPSGTEHAAGVLIGDPVGGAFAIFLSDDDGEKWRPWGRGGFGWKSKCGERRPKASRDEALFAASNESALYFFSSHFLFVTGGPSGARLVYEDFRDFDGPPCWSTLSSVGLPLARAVSAGAFALAAKNNRAYFPLRLMVVGGDFTKPDAASGNAAFLSSRDGAHVPLSSYFNLTVPVTPPHGYRSAVAYDIQSDTWITVGPNGTDISADEGRNWSSLTPGPTDAPDANKNWNALSLPFAVGPKGRIGKLQRRFNQLQAVR